LYVVLQVPHTPSNWYGDRAPPSMLTWKFIAYSSATYRVIPDPAC
jgi:hypothetical protein